MTVRRLIVSALLTSCVLLVASSALAAPAKPGPLGSASFLAPTPPSDPKAVSGGFGLFHFYGVTYAGAYFTYAQRVTGGEHPVAIVGQFSFHHSGYFEETPVTLMGGAQATVMHNENLCFSGRGLLGFTHWGGESTDFAFQLTGVLDYHLKQVKGLSVEVEVGAIFNNSDGIEGGLVLNFGIMKTFGGK
jgi:hypothetical protein